MATVAPPALDSLLRQLNAFYPGSEYGGIVGDAAHGNSGYHISRQDVAPGDYSIQYADDLVGDSTFASAMDFTWRNSAGLTGVVRKLLNAWLAQDPRLDHVRAFNGTVDGVTPLRWDISQGAPSNTTSTDDSHLWHLHLEVFRKYANDSATMQNIFSVLTGATASSTDEDEDIKMHYFIQLKGKAPVFLTDGSTSQHVIDKNHLADINTLAKEGLIKLASDKIRVVSNINLIAPIVGPVPSGFESRKANQ